MPALFLRTSPASIRTATTAVITMTNSPPSVTALTCCTGLAARMQTAAKARDWAVTDRILQLPTMTRRSLGPIPLRITKDCQPGLYTLRLGVTYTDNANQSHTLTDTVDFVVGDPPPPNPNPNPNPNPHPQDPQHPQNPPSSKAPNPEGPVVVTVPDYTNVRLGPGTDYSIVRSVPRGTRAKVLGLGPWDDWYLVEIDGIYGRVWICQDLTVLSGSLTGIARKNLGGPSTAPALTYRW